MTFPFSSIEYFVPSMVTSKVFPASAFLIRSVAFVLSGSPIVYSLPAIVTLSPTAKSVENVAFSPTVFKVPFKPASCAFNT